MGKIVALDKDKTDWRTLLHQLLENDEIESVVCVVRRNGKWETMLNRAEDNILVAAAKDFPSPAELETMRVK